MAQTNWSSLGTPLSQTDFPIHPIVAHNADGRLEVFFQALAGTVTQIWHIWQTSPGGGWSGWASLNQPASVSIDSEIAVGMNADGRLEIFITGSDGALWHIWQTTAGGSWSPTWFSSGKPSATVDTNEPPAVSQNADGRLEVFTLDSDGAIWHISQSAPNGTWSAWASLSTPTTTQFTSLPTVSMNADGRLEVLVTGNDGALWHIWQTSPGGGWSGWSSLGAPPNTSLASSSPCVAGNTDGRLEVFAVVSGTLWHVSQVTPGGPWG